MTRKPNEFTSEESTHRGRLRSVASIGAALLLVLAAISGAGVFFTGTASATHECNGIDMVVSAVVVGFNYVDPRDDSDGAENAKEVCGRNHVAHVVEDMKQSDADQEHVDYYTGAAGAYEQSESHWVSKSNTLHDTDAVIWGRGQADSIEAWKNGSGTAGMETAMRGTIADYYARQQINTLENAETHMMQLEYIRNSSEMEDYISADQVFAGGHATENGTITSDWEDDRSRDASFSYDTANVTFSLANGDTHTIEVLVTGDYRSGCNCEYKKLWIPTDAKYVVTNEFERESSNDDGLHVEYVNSHRTTWNGTAWVSSETGAVILANAPNSNYNDTVAYDPSFYAANYKTAAETNDQMQANVDKWIPSIYDALESGEVDPDEAIPALTQIDYYTDAQADGNYYVYTVGMLSSLGLETPDLNSTGHMTLKYNGNTYDGFLMSYNAPSGGWDVGTTYNTADFEGSEFFITKSGEELTLDGEFTLTGAYDKDGNDVSTVDTTKYVYKTYNNSDFTALIEEMQKLRQEVENREPDGAGTGPGPDGIGIVAGVGILVLLVGALYVASASKREDGR